MDRRDFLYSALGTAAIGKISGLKAWASGNSAELNTEHFVDLRGHTRPVVASSLHLQGSNPQGETIRFTNLFMERAGKPFFVIAGEFHYSRFPAEYWNEELSKVRAGGINTVSTYVFWNHHEETEGKFVWTDRKDLRRFIQLCQDNKLSVILRIGPYGHGEVRNGGLPDWLYGKPIQVRSNDPAYLEYARRLYSQISEQTHGLLYKDGGPIIGLQLENEFMAATSPWEIADYRDAPIDWVPAGDGGVDHMMHLKQIAQEVGLHAPIYTCTSWGSPVPENEFLPTFGAYAFQPWAISAETHQQPPSYSFLFEDAQSLLSADGNKHASPTQGLIPFACCENGGGMQCFYRSRFIVPPQSVQGITLTRVANGSNFIGYYMYHGGSNPIGDHSFMNEYDVPKISYDFQAPLREFGQAADSYRYLRPIHTFLMNYAEQLAPMTTVLPAGMNKITPQDTASLRFAVRAANNQGFLFLNNYQDHVQMPDRTDIAITLRLDNDEMRIPATGGFGLAASEGAILPFNFMAGDAHLHYATAQLITELQVDDALHLFFFAPYGMQPEYCFSVASLKNLEAPNTQIFHIGDRVILRPTAGLGNTIRYKSNEKHVELHTLTREESLQFCKLHIEGRDRAVVSTATVVEQSGVLECWHMQDPNVELFVFPALKNIPAQMRVETQQGHFTVYRSSHPIRKIDCVVSKPSASEAVITISPDSFDGLDDILLSIRYRGDIGNAFINGQLINDNFANGAPWEIGLKRFQKMLPGNTITLKITPMLRGTNVVLDTTMARRQRFEGEKIAEIDGIEAIPVYKSVCGKLNASD